MKTSPLAERVRRSAVLLGRNPSAWYLLGGLVLLAASIWVPFATADRTARVELRADRICQSLLATVRSFGQQIEPGDLDIVHARFLRQALADGAFVADLERVDPAPGTLLMLRSKHYAFHLAVSAPDAKATVGDGTEPACEVAAWPLAANGPAHTAFFLPDGAPRAFTRNLAAGYVGTEERRLMPSRAHRAPGAANESPHAYRGYDDERWLLY
jgi:hypothetical protein